MSELTILHANAAGANERRLAGWSSFLGVPARLVPIPAAEDVQRFFAGTEAVAMSAGTLAVLEARGFLPRNAGGLIHGYEATAEHTALAARWSGGAVRAVAAISGADRCSFPRGSRTHTRQLAGCELERDAAAGDSGFDLEPGSKAETLMELAGRPAFIRAGTWFHWAGGAPLADPNERVADEAWLRRGDRLVPAIMFLRAMFPEACWENPLRTARVIIDDPPLASRYGFLKYADLFASLERLRFGATTAFIPWNHLRTSAKAGRLFAGQHPAHSICVHGCDHTDQEFAATDPALLLQKSRAALARMESHERRTGVPWDRVMVFPQGKFSTAAMGALRQAGFLAVVNSTRLATDGDGTTLGEELLPATNRLAGLPTFTRRYPRQLAAFALDLFLGKPAFVVEHHDWFEHGCGELERCIRFLQEVEPALTWPSLAEGLARQHLRRTAGDGKSHVRFFTSAFQFASPAERERTFVFTRPEPHQCHVRHVKVDGREVTFTHRDGFIEFECALAPRQEVSIQSHDAAPETRAAWEPGLKYRALVRVRRTLSEFRDNHLARHPALLRTAKAGMRRLMPHRS